MGKLIAGMASSHAATLEDPTHWHDHRAHNRGIYAKRYGVMPPEQPQIARETPEDLQTRYAHIREGLDALKKRLEALRPDALIVIGDDQNENFSEANLPQIAIFVGDGFLARARNSRLEPLSYRSHPVLGEAILAECVDAGIDMASMRKFPDNTLLAHAFGPILRTIDPEARLPVIPIFVNAIHVPAPSPQRCYFYGQTIGRAIEKCASVDRVAIYASGGMSHFTAGYPWRHYHGSYTHGGISEDFDRRLMAQMRAGEGHRFAELTNDEIIGNGEIEFRSWITMLGAVGDVRPEFLTYEPFYSAIMGTAVGYWNLAN
jgi:aromatic ring-opening dioxygenase catalytic subunit (LigB family)